MKHRLFIALRPSGQFIQQLCQYRDQASLGSGPFRWEPADKLHITLKFLGDADPEQLLSIRHSLEFLSEYREFHLGFSGFGVFFRGARPAVLWAGFQEHNTLNALVRRLDDMFVPLGFPRAEKKFQPHITLLRIRNEFPQPLIDRFRRFRAEGFRLDGTGVALYESVLHAKGSTYRILENYHLKK